MSLLIANHFQQGEEIKVQYPVGAGLDIITGKFLEGKNGRFHLCGGWNKIMGFGGRGNTYKSTLERYGSVTVTGRYTNNGHIILDSEDSIELPRYYTQCEHWPRLAGRDLVEEGYLRVSDTGTTLNSFVKGLRNASSQIAGMKDVDKYRVTLKYVNKRGEQVRALPPTLVEIDSLTKANVDVVEDIYDNHEIGDSEMNVEAMRGMAAKTQAINQLPKITTQSNFYIGMVAHMTNKIEVGGRFAPDTKQLAGLKAGIKFVGVPNSYTFLTNTLFICQKTTPLINKTDKAPEYPSDPKTKNVSNDLVEIDIYTVRCKTAPTGYGTRVVASQTMGVLPHLTNLHNLRVHFKYYGLGDNSTNFAFDVYPTVKMSRNTCRAMLEGPTANKLLQRAAELTHEIRQMHEVYPERYAKELCTPKELHDDLVAKGYCWDKMLNTRGYPVSDEQEAEEEQVELSTFDILRLRTGDLELPEFKVK